ncbi:MAG TPA: neutral zinc metallopeptidase [Pseudonocardiaceae bacterium]
MRFNENAELDTSQIEDLRSGGGGGLGGRIALGGGGVSVAGIIIYLLISVLGGGGSVPGGLSDGLSGVGAGQSADNSQLEQECRTGADANENQDCRIVAVVNSIQAYWRDQFARSGETYRPAVTNFFRGQVNTACGGATSAVGPFYCPGDNEVYIDLDFFDELRTRFGATGGAFVEAYVLAHEYGHHVQNLLGTSDRVDNRDTGPTSGAVRLELQADCYAGVWSNHATTTPTANGQPLIVELTQQDIDDALDAASRIGDDYIQSELGGGQVNPDAFTHGTSAQRQRWFGTGYESGEPARCNTFDTNDLG